MLNEFSPFRDWAEKWKTRSTIGVAYDRKVATDCQLAHLNEFIGDMPICKIKTMHIDEMLISRANYNPNTKKPMSKSYLTEICCLAKSIFNYAIHNCDTQFLNPAEYLRIPSNLEKEKVRALNETEQQWIFDMPHTLHCGCLLMMFCGLRRGELMALRWSDIDFDNKVVHITKTVAKSKSNVFYVKPKPKNGKDRHVDIPDEIIPLLHSYYEKRDNILVTHQKKSGALHTPKSWTQLWKSYFNELNRVYGHMECQSKFAPKKLPIVIDKINPHMLRHTYATMLYNAGVDIMTASELLGHADIETTLKIYTELRKNTKKHSIGKFDDYIKMTFKREQDEEKSNEEHKKSDETKNDQIIEQKESA